MAGYLHDGASRRATWLRTGDLGVLDEQGRLFVTGRLKDLLIVDGRNFYAHDVEHALRGLPELKPGRAHAFARAGKRREDIIVAVVGRRGAARDPRCPERVKRRVLARCGLAVDDVVFLPHMPRTPSGKIRRAACERLALAQPRGAGR